MAILPSARKKLWLLKVHSMISERAKIVLNRKIQNIGQGGYKIRGYACWPTQPDQGVRICEEEWDQTERATVAKGIKKRR